MAKVRKSNNSKKKPIEQYDHKGKQRTNNPPVGLVTPETDKETGKKTYEHGGFGKWQCGVSKNPADVASILEQAVNAM